jgi:hypothetical protein
MGLDQQAIDAYLAKEAAENGDVPDIEVLEENWNAVRVYLLCHWDIQPFFNFGPGGGASGFRYLGIHASEIESVARTLDARCDEDLLGRVRALARESAALLNKD